MLIKINTILYFDNQFSLLLIKSSNIIKIIKAKIWPPLSVPYFAKLIKKRFINAKTNNEYNFMRRLILDFSNKKLSKKNKFANIKIISPDACNK